MNFDRPRGTRDFRPEEMEKRRWLEGVFRETFRRYGYREIQTPTFEHTALFEAKSGPNVVKEIYAFEDKGGRSICLRPELTAPVMRFYVNELTHDPKPIKMFYFGHCFRYEEPQEGRYREFWQFGLELIGPEGPAADAEVIAVSHAALRDAGLKGFILHVGHIGVLRALTGELGFADDKKAELFRRIDKDDPELALFLETHGAPPALGAAIVATARHERALNLADASAVAAYFTQARAHVAEAVTGDAAERVATALAQLEETVALLSAYGVDALHVDLGVARGLDYYTGTVFEFEAPALGAQKQIGGGGAYTLAELFGAEHVGSAGFGLGFDRILLALEREEGIPEMPPVADVYVAILGDSARVPALRLAHSIRKAGISVDADLMGRKMGKSLQFAAKLGARIVLIAGEKDLAEGNVTLRDMRTGDQTPVALDKVADEVARRLSA